MSTPLRLPPLDVGRWTLNVERFFLFGFAGLALLPSALAQEETDREPGQRDHDDLLAVDRNRFLRGAHSASPVGWVQPNMPRWLRAPEGCIGVDLLVLDEFHGRETVGIEDARELLHGSRFPVNSVGLLVPPDEDVHEARRMLGLLPHLVP